MTHPFASFTLRRTREPTRSQPITTASGLGSLRTPAAGERAHYRVELRGTTPEAPPISAVGFGDFVAMTNPIYVGFP